MVAPDSLPLPPLALLALLALAPLAASQEPDARARTLFLKNCASCHGEKGDGQGTSQLDRPARSFMDGGFSFGNTPEALFRTISVGIPGSPMAGFDTSLSEEERQVLARYVVTLGPPVEEVKDADTILVVRERPEVVRGKLPSLGEGLPEHPRGLLIGDPSGITFEYTVDDVRLLALRQGGFVKRTDWTGRGGTALEPLGKVVTLIDGGKAPPLFSLAAGARPLEAHLSGTHIDGEHVFVAYHLTSGGHEFAHVEESPGLEDLTTGTGYSRLFRITSGRGRVHLAFADPTQVAKQDGTVVSHDEGTVFHCMAKRKGDSQFHVLEFESPRWSRKWNVLILELGPGERATVLLTTYPVNAWDEVRQDLSEEAGESGDSDLDWSRNR